MCERGRIIPDCMCIKVEEAFPDCICANVEESFQTVCVWMWTNYSTLYVYACGRIISSSFVCERGRIILRLSVYKRGSIISKLSVCKRGIIIPRLSVYKRGSIISVLLVCEKRGGIISRLCVWTWKNIPRLFVCQCRIIIFSLFCSIRSMLAYYF